MAKKVERSEGDSVIYTLAVSVCMFTVDEMERNKKDRRENSGRFCGGGEGEVMQHLFTTDG